MCCRISYMWYHCMPWCDTFYCMHVFLVYHDVLLHFFYSVGNLPVALMCLRYYLDWSHWWHHSFRFNQPIQLNFSSMMMMLYQSLPVCQWKPPRKRKESTMDMAEAPFMKHVYSRERKWTMQSLEDLIPVHLSFEALYVIVFLVSWEKVRREHLCISLLFDEHYHH